MTGERDEHPTARRPRAFGVLLRRQRRAAGLTQEALAERAGLSVRGLQHLEAGDACPSRATLDGLLEALDALGLPAEDRAQLAAARRPAGRHRARRRGPSGAAPPGAGPAPAPLPASLSSFVGREQALAALRLRLPTSRLLTLTGPGGSGKTRLALRLAADAAGDFAAGCRLVDLAPVRDADVVSAAVATACGVRDEGGRPLPAALSDALRPEHLLLVLDNCEHLAGACAALADALLRACPSVTVLATSREPLGVAGEIAWRVPPLEVPPGGAPEAPADQLRYEAVRLFAARARDVQPDFAVTARNAPAVAELCRRLDGLPLALELAAARLRALTVEQVLARLDDRFRLLTGGSRTAPPRQQTLRRTVEWSYDLLTAPERRLFARLAVFAGGWSLEAAEAVGGGASPGAGDALDVLDGLTRLVDRSLVVAETPVEGAARYRLLETLREYALERLEAEGDGAAPAGRGRHAAYYLFLAERAAGGIRGPRSGDWFALLEGEHGNLRAALDWFSGCGAIGDGLRLCAALWRFWWIRGHLGEGRARLEHFLGRVDTASPSREDAEAHAVALYGAGLIARYQGDFAAARAFHTEALVRWRAAGDTEGVGQALLVLGTLEYQAGSAEAARRRYEQGLAAVCAAGDRAGTVWATIHLGAAVAALGDGARGRSLLEDGLAGARELGEQVAEAWALRHLAAVDVDEGDLAAARGLLTRSLAVSQELGDRRHTAHILELLAEVEAAHGRLDRALRLAGNAHRRRAALGSPPVPRDAARLRRWLEPALAAAGPAGRAAWAAGEAEADDHADGAVAALLAGPGAAGGGGEERRRSAGASAVVTTRAAQSVGVPSQYPTSTRSGRKNRRRLL
jgi:predicted ATPase/transcriptional regulator with XRE-family HTH domain